MTCPRHVLIPVLYLALFAYTSGHWLRLDKSQCEARYIKFNFDRLFEAVSLCPGATSVESVEKREGGFSKAFVVKMDNGSSVFVKFPTSDVGERRYVTNSEVATVLIVSDE